jgi:hypothetical protein
LNATLTSLVRALIPSRRAAAAAPPARRARPAVEGLEGRRLLTSYLGSGGDVGEYITGMAAASGVTLAQLQQLRLMAQSRFNTLGTSGTNYQGFYQAAVGNTWVPSIGSYLNGQDATTRSTLWGVDALFNRQSMADVAYPSDLPLPLSVQQALNPSSASRPQVVNPGVDPLAALRVGNGGSFAGLLSGLNHSFAASPTTAPDFSGGGWGYGGYASPYAMTYGAAVPAGPSFGFGAGPMSYF